MLYSWSLTIRAHGDPGRRLQWERTSNLEEAVLDLARREGTSERYVGVVIIGSTRARSIVIPSLPRELEGRASKGS